MSKPIGYYASAPSGTKDNAILCEIESNYGSWLEELTPSQKSAWAIALLTEAATNLRRDTWGEIRKVTKK